jgi:hypothetical protein
LLTEKNLIFFNISVIIIMDNRGVTDMPDKNKKSKKSDTILGKKRKSNYDSAWKTIIKRFFKFFLAFFFPEIYAAIDLEKEPEFLDNELMEISPGSNLRDRVSDVLAKVWLKNGTPQYIAIVIHFEIQGKAQKDFLKRMFIYFYRAYDRMVKDNIPVISLAILTDTNKKFRPNEFVYSLFGFEVRMKIPIIKLIDYRTDPVLKEKLENSDNPMSLIVQAQLNSMELKHAPDEMKYEVTKELIRQCYKKGYDKDTRFGILFFLAWVTKVSELHKKKLNELVREKEEVKKMDFIPFFLEDTVRERVRESRRKGSDNAKKRIAISMLRDNFPLEIIAKHTGLPHEKIQKLAPGQI